MKTSKAFLLFSAFSLMLLNACKPDEKEKIETVQSAEDNSQMENEFSAAYEASDDVAQTNSKTFKTGNGVLPSGAVVSFTDSLFTDGDGVDFQIDYGAQPATAPKGLLCKDGRYRSGVLNISMTKRWSETGCVMTIDVPASNQYYAGNGTDQIQYSGTKTISRVNDSTWNIAVVNGTAYTPRGTISWQTSRTVTRIYNAGIGFYGDIYSVTGSASGNNKNGDPFTVQINTALIKKVEFPCASTFIKGKLTVTNTSTSKTIAIDYDPYNNEACDRIAKATLNGKDYFYTVR